MRVSALPFACLILLASCFAQEAQARHGGLYFELAPGLGMMNTDEVIVGEDGDVAESSFSPGLKLGFNLFGWAGAEAQFAGTFWNLGSNDVGGAGFAGGVVRVTPLEVLSFVIPDTVEIPSILPAGPVTWKDRPFDLGFSVGGGYAIAGEDYAYQGGYFQWGFDLKFFITPNFALGIDLPFRHTIFEPFRYTDFGDGDGLCTDGGKAFGRSGTEYAPSPIRAGGDELSASDVSSCKGRPPDALFFAPALTIAGVFDFGI